MKTSQKLFITAAVAIVVLSGCLQAHPTQFLDATDVCILICDKCYKNEAALRCGNHCLAKSGKVDQFWKQQCPYFSLNEPQVVQMM